MSYRPPERKRNLAASFTSYVKNQRICTIERDLCDSDLVECWEDVIPKLDLRDGSVTHRRETDAEPCNSLFGERCVEDSVPPELFCETHGASENSAKSDVFTENDGGVVPVHRVAISHRVSITPQ